MGTSVIRFDKCLLFGTVMITVSGCNFPGEGLIDRFKTPAQEHSAVTEYFEQTAPPAPTPHAPANLRSSMVMPTSAQLEWDAPTNVMSAITYTTGSLSC